MIQKLTELSGSMNVYSRHLYILMSAAVGMWIMSGWMETNMRYGHGQSDIGK